MFIECENLKILIKITLTAETFHFVAMNWSVNIGEIWYFI